MNSPEARGLASDPVLGPVLEDVCANGQSALAKHLADPAVMARLTQVAAPMLAAQKSGR